jgi:dUTP pyrophosphatase
MLKQMEELFNRAQTWMGQAEARMVELGQKTEAKASELFDQAAAFSRDMAYDIKKLREKVGLQQPEVKVSIVHPAAKIPSYSNVGPNGDTCADLYSVEVVHIGSGQRALVPTGIKFELPEGWQAKIQDRSGLALKKGLTTLGRMIDCGYRGELGVLLFNTSDSEVVVQAGDRIASIEIRPFYQAKFSEAEELKESSRGAAGFGSTGK